MRLVRAPNAAQALRHAVADTLAVAVATQDDLVRHIADGVEVENSGGATPHGAVIDAGKEHAK
jgi:hypothetical protein